jgi:uncharacterized Zn-finger protein
LAKARTDLIDGALSMTAKTSDTAGPAAEVVYVHGHRIACDGVGGALGHPRVFMEMGDEAFVDCPYCDRRFVHAEAGHDTPVPGVYDIGGGH